MLKATQQVRGRARIRTNILRLPIQRVLALRISVSLKNPTTATPVDPLRMGDGEREMLHTGTHNICTLFEGGVVILGFQGKSFCATFYCSK